MRSITSRSFGQVIRERRRTLDLTQEDLARRIETSVPYVGHLETGKRHPSEKLVVKLAAVLGLDPRADQLVTGRAWIDDPRPHAVFGERVAMTNTACLNLDSRVTRRRLSYWLFLRREPSTSATYDYLFHVQKSLMKIGLKVEAQF